MQQSDIEQLLIRSFEDRKLSQDEKFAVAELGQNLSGQRDKISFVRNRAFSLLLEQGAFSEEQFRAIKWLENLVKTLDKNSATESVDADACFSPGTDCQQRILSLCNNAHNSIDVCVFTISDNQLSDALFSAHQRGVNVRIISDNDKRNDKGSDVYSLVEKGVPVVVDRTDAHMHHKFAIFDGKQLLNGSFNWTRSASKYNQENILVTDNKELLGKFSREFERLWNNLK